MRTRYAFLALHVAVGLFGFAGLFGKWLTLPPFAIVLGRAGIAAIALALIVALARRRFRPDPVLARNGIVLAVHWVTFFEAIRVSSVAIGLLGYASFPLFVLVIERIGRGTPLRRDQVATAVMVVAGLVTLVPSFSLEERAVQGLAWGLVSGFTFALLAVRSRRLASAYAPMEIALWQNAFAALVLLPLAFIGRASIGTLAPGDVGLLLVLGVACTAFAHTLFITGLRHVTAHTASIVAALEPVYGIALAAWLLGEQPSLRTLIGATLIVGAAIVATRREPVAAV